MSATPPLLPDGAPPCDPGDLMCETLTLTPPWLSLESLEELNSDTSPIVPLDDLAGTYAMPPMPFEEETNAEEEAKAGEVQHET